MRPCSLLTALNFRTGTDRHDTIFVSLLLLVAETKKIFSNQKQSKETWLLQMMKFWIREIFKETSISYSSSRTTTWIIPKQQPSKHFVYLSLCMIYVVCHTSTGILNFLRWYFILHDR